MARCIPCLDPPPLPTEDDSRLSPSSVLLDDKAYISAAAVFNATTAVGSMSTGNPVQVSFCLAYAPRLSYFCVHFPGPVPDPIDPFLGPARGTPAVRCVREAPRLISTHANLALIRISIPGAVDIRKDSAHDYFVYTARPTSGESSLDRLPRPHPSRFRDCDAAIVRCSLARYVVACLSNTREPMEFLFQLYDSDTRRWTSRMLHLDAPERDRVLPIPESAFWYGPLFHHTTKIIVIGGPGATVGWVDLWRGILFCDVLDEEPVLRDMPLPKPAKGNRRSFCTGCPHPSRDIAVVTLPEQAVKIKFVEMETRQGEVLPPQRAGGQSGYSDSDSDYDDVDDNVADFWKAHIWTMPVPIGSWKDWHRDCTLDVTDIVVDNPRHAELLLTLPRHSADPEEAIWSLRRLNIGHPALGLCVDGDVIYFLSKINLMDRKGWVIAVEARERKLKGVAEIDHKKLLSFRRYYRPTDISKYLVKATGGEAGTLRRTMVKNRR